MAIAGMVMATGGAAQRLPPAEAPLPMPGTQTSQSTLRLNTTEVLVPTLVEKKNGEILYGLKERDFILEDNGVRKRSACRRRWTRLRWRWWWRWSWAA